MQPRIMIRLIRELLGYSRADLASIMGITQWHLAKIEDGSIAMGKPFLESFCTATQCKMEALTQPDSRIRVIMARAGFEPSAAMQPIRPLDSPE